MRHLSWILAVSFGLVPALASAQGNLAFRRGVTLEVGGGVTDFAGDTMNRSTDVGGLWEARAVFRSAAPLGFEAAYVGTAQRIEALGLDADDAASLMSTGLEAVARLHAPIALGRDVRLEPFAFGGVGWARFDLVNHRSNTSSLHEDDGIYTMPFGGGVALGVGSFVLDTRFTYRGAFDEDLAPSGGGQANLGRWSWNALVGYEF